MRPMAVASRAAGALEPNRLVLCPLTACNRIKAMIHAGAGLERAPKVGSRVRPLAIGRS
jgi:hypothetical protein